MAKRVHDDETKYFDYNVHVPSRTIYVGSHSYDEEYGEMGIDYLTSEHLIKALHLLETYNQNQITIHYNMIGGEWYHGIAMYDFMKACRSHITIIGFGQVRSMGTVVMQGADERLLSANARFMIHDGQEGYVGKPKDVINYAIESKYTLEKCYDIYYEALKDKYFHGVSKKRAFNQISKWCDTDTYFGAEEAVDMGFVDGIYTGKE